MTSKDDWRLDVWSHNETQPPLQRVVLLGASNLSRGFPVAVSMSRSAFNAPLAYFVAKGHGRSYGIESQCFGKKISGIFSCGIWRALEQEKGVPITAFMTDIGNDLAYEVPVETVLGWVEQCLDRLLSLGSQVVLCDLPLERLRQLSAIQYRCFRALFFPGCRLHWNEMLERAERLSVLLQAMAKSRKNPLFIGRNEWYGADPIHVRRSCYPALWSELLALTTPTSGSTAAYRRSLRLAWYLRGLRPESWSLMSFARSASQPVGRLRDGSTISLY